MLWITHGLINLLLIQRFRASGRKEFFQVDDSPRYEGSASWVHVDGRSFWSSTADAPLPRREITKRQDYNVTFRRNHHEIFDWGWSHDQDNDKLIREVDKKDIILAQEKGYNTYKKVENERCMAAQVFWKDNKEMWALVRKEWNTIFSMPQNIHLKQWRADACDANNAGETGGVDDPGDARDAGGGGVAGHAGNAGDVGNAGGTNKAGNADNADDAGNAGERP